MDRIDWHDREYIRIEEAKQGNGEHGKRATLPPNHDNNKCDVNQVYKNIGYNGCLSDYISIHRSVPDFRPAECQNMTYSRHLPDVSVIIPVFNEHWSVLLRAIHSILDRAPASLIKEMILIDDGSTYEDMKERLDNYIALNLPKARVLHLPPPRKGLMGARLLGAHNATGKVLVFMDSNIEANVNWLPPLLEPIVEDYRTCVCPVIDFINIKSFSHIKLRTGTRNTFTWKFSMNRLPPLPETLENPAKPYECPTMVGCAFAISRDFFWELGGYDPGLQVWGGEQFELSFKVWLCGGSLVDAPCSRVSHLYRAQWQPFSNPGVGNYIGRNARRVIEVWMDEYAEQVYSQKPDWKKLDPGDLGAQRQLRQSLKCKPFEWYMRRVASDMNDRLLLVGPSNVRSFRVMPTLDGELCLTAPQNNGTIRLQNCSSTSIDNSQKEFLLRWTSKMELKRDSVCLDLHTECPRFPLLNGAICGNHSWEYNPETQILAFDNNQLCLDHCTKSGEVFLEKCDKISETQKWRIRPVKEISDGIE